MLLPTIPSRQFAEINIFVSEEFSLEKHQMCSMKGKVTFIINSIPARISLKGFPKKCIKIH